MDNHALDSHIRVRYMRIVEEEIIHVNLAMLGYASKGISLLGHPNLHVFTPVVNDY